MWFLIDVSDTNCPSCPVILRHPSPDCQSPKFVLHPLFPNTKKRSRPPPVEEATAPQKVGRRRRLTDTWRTIPESDVGNKRFQLDDDGCWHCLKVSIGFGSFVGRCCGGRLYHEIEVESSKNVDGIQSSAPIKKAHVGDCDDSDSNRFLN